MKNTVKNVAAKSTIEAITIKAIDALEAKKAAKVAKLTKEMNAAEKAGAYHEASAIQDEINEAKKVAIKAIDALEAKKATAKKATAKKATAKKATAKKATAKKATAKKATAKKATTVPVDRKAPIADTKTIVKLVDGNPRAEGSIGHASYALLKKGMTIAQYLSKGGRRKDLAWDLRHKYVKVV